MNEAPQPSIASPRSPAIPLSRVSKACRDEAAKLQRALHRALILRSNPNVSSADRERIGLEDYKREFDQTISARYLRRLVKRAIDRDGGAGQWQKLELYLPDHPKAKVVAALNVPEPIAEILDRIQATIESTATVEDVNARHEGVWKVAIKCYQELLAMGQTSKRTARQVRAFLLARAPFMFPSADALLKAFNLRLEQLRRNGDDLSKTFDGRANNGDWVIVPEEDVARLRNSSAFKNGGRIDAAWREEYHRLSERTRERYQWSLRCPRKIVEILSREKVDVLVARHQGKRTVRVMVGGIERDWEGMPSMHTFVFDDTTSDIESFARKHRIPLYLFLAQIVAGMDSASRKFVGWAVSDDKGPTAELVCEAVLDAFRREGVPSVLGLENGFVFGKALNVNGKEDDQGRTVVAGLAQYGCTVRHFEKMNPRAKAELEKGFDLIRHRMQQHPGYKGSVAMTDASEQFTREQRLILSRKVEPEEYRYSFDELAKRLAEMFDDYNNTPQRGHLKGLSPNEAHEILKDKKCPHIPYTPWLAWLLANARYLVTVEAGGVRFNHYGRPLRVRGGRLPQLIGSELWAIVKRRDDSMVSFLNTHFADPFTIEACEKVCPSQRLLLTGSDVLARERAKVREHERAIDLEYKESIKRFGNPRRDLLLEIRNQQPEAEPAPERVTMVSKRLADSFATMEKQRAEIKSTQKERAGRKQNLKAKAARYNTPAILVEDGDEDAARALELKQEAARQRERELERNQ